MSSTPRSVSGSNSATNSPRHKGSTHTRAPAIPSHTITISANIIILRRSTESIYLTFNCALCCVCIGRASCNTHTHTRKCYHTAASFCMHIACFVIVTVCTQLHRHRHHHVTLSSTPARAHTRCMTHHLTHIFIYHSPTHRVCHHHACYSAMQTMTHHTLTHSASPRTRAHSTSIDTHIYSTLHHHSAV